MTSAADSSPAPHASLPRALRLTLLSTTLLDEATIGFAIVGLPLLRDRFHLSYAEAGLLFTIAALSSLVLEPIINITTDRIPKKLPILAGMLGIVLAYALAGAAANYAMLIFAFALLYPAIGTVLGLSQATLIDVAPHAAGRTMTRWTLMASIGDLLAPTITAVVVALRLGWPALCLIASVVWIGAAALLLVQRFPHLTIADDSETDEPSAGWRATLRGLVSDHTLLRWVIVVLLADMMDEVFLGFAGFYLRDRLHIPASLVSLTLGAQLVAGLLALLVLDRMQSRISGMHLLPWLAAVTLAGVVLLLVAPAGWIAIPALALCGAGAAGWYPIAKAAAYASRPGRSGLVRAVIGLGEPYNMALPGITGFIAASFGISAAIAFLGLSAPAVLIARPRRVDPKQR